MLQGGTPPVGWLLQTLLGYLALGTEEPVVLLRSTTCSWLLIPFVRDTAHSLQCLDHCDQHFFVVGCRQAQP